MTRGFFLHAAKTCFAHDLCYFENCVYTECSCYYSPQSQATGCDDPFFAACAISAHALPDDLAQLNAESDLIVNCTSLGMEGTGTEAQSPCDLAAAAPGALAVDIVYAPEETAFLAAAKAAGLPALGGLPMLVHQGALSFELWTGQRAPLHVMRAAAEAALRARAGARSR